MEFALKEEAEKAIKGTTGTTFLEKTITTYVELSPSKRILSFSFLTVFLRLTD